MIGLSQLLVATDFSERAVLRDGTLATLRLTRPEDHDGVRRFFHELSPESRRLRFFTCPIPRRRSSRPSAIRAIRRVRPRSSLSVMATGSLDRLRSARISTSAAAGHRHELAYGAALPEAARRYLDHAKAPAASLASAVHLRMHGEIKLGIWLPFEAEQDISRDGRMLWRATVRGCGVPLFRGFDRLEAGQGEMQWKLFGIAPIVTATGPDISRSTAGRLLAESIWLPSLLSDVPWSSRDPRHATAAVTAAGYSSSIELTLDDAGRVEMVKTPRWGCPGGGPFRLVDFGGMVEAESTFEGYTIPTRLRAGWYVGTPRFDRDGEFFRVAVDHATFR